LYKLSTLISVFSIIILVGYIVFNETNKSNHAKNSIDPPDLKKANVEIGSNGKTISYNLPTELYFAGERVPLEVTDVKERLDLEIHINIYWHNNTIFLIKRANRWLPQMEKILREYGIPDDFKYLSVIESALINDISSKNAEGFWQFLKGTAKEYGLEVNKEVDERYNPLKSTAAACRYFKKSYQKFNNWTLVAASYDRGMRGIQRSLDDQLVDSYYDMLLNRETSRYVFRILAIKEILENPEKYGFEIDEGHLYKQEPITEVEVKTTLNDLVAFANQNGINYKILKRYNPWIRGKKLTVKKGRSYRISIPSSIENIEISASAK